MKFGQYFHICKRNNCTERTFIHVQTVIVLRLLGKNQNLGIVQLVPPLPRDQGSPVSLWTDKGGPQINWSPIC